MCFRVHRLISQELDVIAKLAKAGISTTTARTLLIASQSSKRTDESADGGGLGDLYDLREPIENANGQPIIWLNDLEEDPDYAEWAADLSHLLRPIYPGQMYQIRKNIFNVVFVLDLSNPESLKLLIEEVFVYIDRLIPIRFGFLPLIRTQDGNTVIF